MNRHRMKRSPVWKMPEEAFRDLVKNSHTYGEVLAYFGLANKGGNYRTLRDRMERDRVDHSHFRKCYNTMVMDNIASRKSLSEVMVVGSRYSRSFLKKRLLREGVKKNVCEICGQKGEWNGKPLMMVLDHKNGVSNDHRAGNLRMICPNCNSQLPTFAGRHTSKRRPRRSCSKCGKVLSRSNRSGLCRKCQPFRLRRAERPDKDVLAREVEEIGFLATGRKYGVSDNAIRKWLR